MFRKKPRNEKWETIARRAVLKDLLRDVVLIPLGYACLISLGFACLILMCAL